jgi:hypothetical protein
MIYQWYKSATQVKLNRTTAAGNKKLKRKMRNMFLKCMLMLPFAFVINNASQAQSAEAISAMYPNDYAVITNYSQDTRIFLKDGKPQAESKVNVEILILDDKANGLFNKYKVYHGSFNEIKGLEAFTKVPDGRGFKKIKVGEIKTESSRSKGVFYDDAKESAFDFPSLVKGAVANVSYTEINTDPHLLSPFYFVSYMPVVSSKFTLSCSSDIEVRYTVKNDNNHLVSITEDNKGRERSYQFKATNVKAADRYNDAPPISYYEPHVIVQVASYKNDKGEVTKYLGNLDDLYRWNYSFIKDLDNTNDEYLKQLADSLTSGLTSEREKAKKIYEWVQQNIKYVAFEDGMEGFIPRRAALVCNRRFGDCKDMASLLTALLQFANVKAYFTWIGTRAIPYDYTDVALPITDNHMIATVNVGNDWIFLDGTDPNCIFGLPSGFIQGKQALVAISDKEYKTLRVPEVEGEKNIITDSTFISLADNGIKGTSSVYYKGYFGSDINSSLQYKDSKDTRDYVKYRMGKASNKFILGDYFIHKLSDEEKTVNIKADFQVPDYSKKIADELYINLNLEKLLTNSSVIDTARRKVAMENDFKYVIRQYTILEVPENYKVSYVPKNYELKDALLGFSIKYIQEQNKIIAVQEMSKNALLIQPKDFINWNASVKQILGQYKEQVVLQKQQ